MAVGALIGTNPYRKETRKMSTKKKSSKKKSSSKKGKKPGRNPFGGGLVKKAKNVGGELIALAAGAAIVEGAAQAILPADWRIGVKGLGVRAAGGFIASEVLPRIPMVGPMVKPYADDLRKGALALAGGMAFMENVAPRLPAKDGLTSMDAVQTLAMARQQMLLAQQPGTQEANAVLDLQKARAALIAMDLHQNPPKQITTSTTDANAGNTGQGELRGRYNAGAGEIIRRTNEGLSRGPVGASRGVAPWGRPKFDFGGN